MCCGFIEAAEKPPPRIFAPGWWQQQERPSPEETDMRPTQLAIHHARRRGLWSFILWSVPLQIAGFFASGIVGLSFGDTIVGFAGGVENPTGRHYNHWLIRESGAIAALVAIFLAALAAAARYRRALNRVRGVAEDGAGGSRRKQTARDRSDEMTSRRSPSSSRRS